VEKPYPGTGHDYALNYTRKRPVAQTPSITDYDLGTLVVFFEATLFAPQKFNHSRNVEREFLVIFFVLKQTVQAIHFFSFFRCHIVLTDAILASFVNSDAIAKEERGTANGECLAQIQAGQRAPES
jgi:hypothetical protein